MNDLFRPHLELFPPEIIPKLIDQAFELLSKKGVWIEDKTTCAQLLETGAIADRNISQNLFLPRHLIEICLKQVPRNLNIFNRHNEISMTLGADKVHFVPGSAALKILDSQTTRHRLAVTADLLSLTQLVNVLPNLAAQATALVPSDVPQAISDSYRLYISLLKSPKPVVTGLFQNDSFPVMHEMILACYSDPENLRHHPGVIFDCCPISPLMWGTTSCQTIRACARTGIPVELIPMPLPGATSPMRLSSTIVQYLAEILSGIVISQTTCPGAPIIAGGAPAAFDMRYGTPAVGAIEILLLAAGFAQALKYLTLPTHTFLGMSDAKIVDAQAGMESGLGSILAALLGFNIVAGAGMLSSINCFSLEKLLIDHEVCAMAQKLISGVQFNPQQIDPVFEGAIHEGDYFLTAVDTLNQIRQEFFESSDLFDRKNDAPGNHNSINERARQKISTILNISKKFEPDQDFAREITKIMQHAARRAGMDKLPWIF